MFADDLALDWNFWPQLLLTTSNEPAACCAEHQLAPASLAPAARPCRCMEEPQPVPGAPLPLEAKAVATGTAQHAPPLQLHRSPATSGASSPYSFDRARQVTTGAWESSVPSPRSANGICNADSGGSAGRPEQMAANGVAAHVGNGNGIAMIVDLDCQPGSQQHVSSGGHHSSESSVERDAEASEQLASGGAKGTVAEHQPNGTVSHAAKARPTKRPSSSTEVPQQPAKRAHASAAAPRLSFADDLEDEEAEALPTAAVGNGSAAGGSGANAGKGSGIGASTAVRFEKERKLHNLQQGHAYQQRQQLGQDKGKGAFQPQGQLPAGCTVVDADDAWAGGSSGSENELSQVVYGVAQACGARPYMEDRVTIITSLRPLSSPPATATTAPSQQLPSRGGRSADGGAWVSYDGHEGATAPATAGSNGSSTTLESTGSGIPLPPDGVLRSYAAVFDGHNGAGAAEIAAGRLHQLLAGDPAMRTLSGERGASSAVRSEDAAVSGALKRAFRKVDDIILQVGREEGKRDGATALVMLALGSVLYAAHAGDSRAVLCRNGVATRLTEDHKPDLPQERRRVEEAGGRVDFQRCWRVVVEPRDGRPGSGLAVSRSLGDLDFKEPARFVECEPEVRRVALQRGDSFVVMASDGLWDVMSDSDAVAHAAKALECLPAGVRPCSEAAARAAAEALLQEALRRHTMDNVSVVVALFQWS